MIDYVLTKMSSSEGYKSMFKGAMVLATLYMVAIMQVSNLMVPIEKSGHELWYKVEAKLGKAVSKIEELECNVENKDTYSDCKLAQYQLDISSSFADALITFQDFVKTLALLLLSLSAIGFLLNPFYHSKAESQGTSANNPPQDTPPETHPSSDEAR